MNFFVIGCGRVGSELALRLYKHGHKVVVIDVNRDALNSLSPEFRGRIIEGDALAEQMLERAGIAEADGVATVTNSDTLNAVVAYIARTLYKVPIVIARNYDPAMLSVCLPILGPKMKKYTDRVPNSLLVPLYSGKTGILLLLLQTMKTNQSGKQ